MSADKETMTFDGLTTGRMQEAQATRTLVSGNTVVRGAVLGRITSGGKLRIWDSGVSDGGQLANCIAAEDMDASGGDKQILVYTAGEFDENKLVISTNETITNLARESLRDFGIHLVKGQTA